METTSFRQRANEPTNPALERFAMGLTGNKEDAKDLVQETFLKALLARINTKVIPT